MQTVDELPPITAAEQEAARELLTEAVGEPIPFEPAKARCNQELIDGLRSLADFLETHDVGSFEWCDQVFHVFCKDKEELRQKLRDIPAPLIKEASDSYYYVRKRFGKNINVAWTVDRKVVCERVKIGEKVVPATPEIIVPEKVLPAQPERVEEVYDWVCPESILRSGA